MDNYVKMSSLYNAAFDQFGADDMRSARWSTDEGSSARARYQQMDAVVPFDGKKILEIGCAFGSFFKFGFECADYVGIDVNENFIRSAQEEYGQYEFICTPVEDFYPPELFDLTISSGVFCNRDIPLNYPRVIEETLRKLHENSRVVAINFPSVYCEIRSETIEYYSPEFILGIALRVTNNVSIIHRERNDFLLLLENQSINPDLIRREP